MSDGYLTTRARSVRAAMDTACPKLTDAEASTAIPLYPVLRYSGKVIPAGTRINWEGRLKRAAVDLWDREDNDPAHAPDLWEDVNYRAGYRIIPEVITAGLAFALGEKGWWGDVLYESAIAANVWTPEQNPSGWTRTDAQ